MTSARIRASCNHTSCVVSVPAHIPTTTGLVASAPRAQPSVPVAESDAPTGFDSGDPRCLR